MYDQGYHELCRAVYDETARIIVEAKGPSASLKSMLAAAHSVAEGHYPADDDIGAWALRRAFDAVLAEVEGNPVPAEAVYPKAVQGNWLSEGPAGTWAMLAEGDDAPTVDTSSDTSPSFDTGSDENDIEVSFGACVPCPTMAVGVAATAALVAAST